MTTDFAATRRAFALPEGLIYLDGNSLGPLPHAALDRMATTMHDEWGAMLVGAWNAAGWMTMPGRVGDRVGRLIGAPPGTTVMGDTLSIKLYQALAAALDLVPDPRSGRRVVLTDSGNFPSDLYIAQGLLGALGRGHELRVVAPEAVAAAIDDSVAVLMLTEVDYRTGRLHDIAALTGAAHDAGAVVVADLAHSTGAIPVDVTASDVDFAVGCAYKYLNGGPGAPAFIYVAPRHAEVVRPALSGWMGHDAPFAFDLDYRAARGVERMRVGTPPVLALATLDAALDVWDAVDMADVRARSIELSELFIAEVERRCPDLTLASPRDPHARGSQVSFRHPHGQAIVQALIAAGVVGDFRRPDVMRFGFTPLYLSEDDVLTAVDRLAAIMRDRTWDDARFRGPAGVT